MQSLKKLARWYFSKKALPYWSLLLIDSMFVIIAGLLAVGLHYGIADTLRMLPELVITFGVILLCFFVGFRAFHTYDGVIRFSSFNDLMRVSGAVVVAIVLVFVAQWGLDRHDWMVSLTTADILLLALFVIAMMWMVRVWVKTLYETTMHSKAQMSAFVLGTGSGAAAIAKNIRTSTESPYSIVGFVSDEQRMIHKRLMGKKIYMFGDGLAREMRQAGATTLIISPMMRDALRDNDEIVNGLIEAGIKIMVMPKAREWDGKSDLNVSELHPVDVEDLLPREKIEVDLKGTSALLKDHVVMITGAAGSIGSEIVRQVSAFGPSRLVLIDQAETPMHDILLMMRRSFPGVPAETIVADITDARMMRRIFEEYRPEYVFHAAAYKHVPMMEMNPYESIVNNVYGTKVVADLAREFGTMNFVMVSTDKAVNPTNVMGASKRICEIYVQSLDKAIKEGKVKGVTQFVTTRFGNVLGSNGSVIPLFQEQIKRGGPVTVTHPDIIRYFMLIPEACKLVIEAGTIGKGGEIFVFDMGKPVRIADLARKMIRLSGAKDVEVVFTGLRDGEKLYEEVLNDKETTLPTPHPLIMVAKVREYDYEEVAREIDALVEKASDQTDMEIVSAMKAIVPEFKSQHSKYEALDEPSQR